MTTNKMQIAPDVAQQLTAATESAATAFGTATASGSVVAALDVARGVEDLRVLFDRPEIKQRILALQDSAIGFRTDKDPKVWNKKANKYNDPYDWPTVRDCAIEASLRGLQLVGNQMNIISSRMYSTREGFEYLIRKLKKVTNFRPVIGVPKGQAGGALIECEATWDNDGVAQSLKVTIPVKGDECSGADQLIGKATRKFLKRCYEMMTGNVIPEGEAGDVEQARQLPVAAPIFATPAPPHPELVEAPKVEPVEVKLTTSSPPASGYLPGLSTKLAINLPSGQSATVPADKTRTIQDDLAAAIGAAGVSFDQLQAWAMELGHWEQELASIDEVPDNVARRLWGARTSMCKSILGGGK